MLFRSQYASAYCIMYSWMCIGNFLQSEFKTATVRWTRSRIFSVSIVNDDGIIEILMQLRLESRWSLETRSVIKYHSPCSLHQLLVTRQSLLLRPRLCFMVKPQLDFC